jgi:hypothetical protein
MRVDDLRDAQAGWNSAKPETIPPPTFWPMFLALAIVSIAYGIIFSEWFIAEGVVVFLVALGGWIRDLRHEYWREDGTASADRET